MDDQRSSASPAPGGWRYYGQRRPPFAVAPVPGEESVWDYPRPPRIERLDREIIVKAGETAIARTQRALRVLETASPPTVYIPRSDVVPTYLHPAPGGSCCEWKGMARYWTVSTPSLRLEGVGWSYDDPGSGFEDIREYVSFYPGRIACYIDGVRVQAQPGGFYGGWVTSELVGPFKGGPGTAGW